MKNLLPSTGVPIHPRQVTEPNWTLTDAIVRGCCHKFNRNGERDGVIHFDAVRTQIGVRLVIRSEAGRTASDIELTSEQIRQIFAIGE